MTINNVKKDPRQPISEKKNLFYVASRTNFFSTFNDLCYGAARTIFKFYKDSEGLKDWEPLKWATIRKKRELLKVFFSTKHFSLNLLI